MSRQHNSIDVTSGEVTSRSQGTWGKRAEVGLMISGLFAGLGGSAVVIDSAIEQVCKDRTGNVTQLDSLPRSPFCDGYADFQDKLGAAGDAFVPDFQPLFEFEQPVYDPFAEPND